MSNCVIQKSTKIKSESCFLWNFLQIRFQCSISRRYPMGSSYGVTTEDTHSHTYTLYQMHFEKATRSMHIKEERFTAYVNYCIY